MPKKVYTSFRDLLGVKFRSKELTTKSTRVSRYSVRQFVQNQQPFHNSGSNHMHPKGSTLWGEWVTRPDTGPVYMVFSYRHSWPLFACWGGCWFSNEDKFSRTTTRHAYIADPITKYVRLSRDQMAHIYQCGVPSDAAIVEAVKLKLLTDPVGIAYAASLRMA